jgi:hypothetical protein
LDEIFLLMGNSLKGQVWNIRVAILDGLVLLFQKLQPGMKLKEQSISAVLSGSAAALEDGKYRSVKERTMKLIETLSNREEIHPPTVQLLVKSLFETLIASETDPIALKTMKLLIKQ